MRAHPRGCDVRPGACWAACAGVCICRCPTAPGPGGLLVARTVLTSMDGFLGNIQPTANQRDRISTSHAAIREYLRSDLTVVGDFLTGSYVRNTMVRQSRDVDLFVV